MNYVFTSVFAAEMQDFLAYLVDGGWYVAKAKCYLRSLDHFMTESNTFVKAIEERLITKWIAAKPVKAETRRNMYSEINRFANYLMSLGFPVNMPEAPRPGKDYVPYIFSEDEFSRIVHAADNFLGAVQVGRSSYLFPMLLRLLYCCGLRLGEGLSLTWGDIDLDSGIITLRATKGRKQRFVPMSTSVTTMLSAYREMTRREGMCADYLFETDPRFGISKPYSKLRFEMWFAVVLGAAGIVCAKDNPHDRGICPHCLRHLFVFDSFLKSESEGRSFEETSPYLSAYLGHEGLSSLEKYITRDYTLYRDSHRRVNDYVKNVFPEVSFSE